MRIVIEKKDLKSIGTNSLIGRVLRENNGMMPETLTFVFKGSSREYIEENNGCEWITMPNFVPFCLLQDVITMIVAYKVNVHVELTKD